MAWLRRWNRARVFLLWMCASWQPIALIGRSALYAPAQLSDVYTGLGVFEVDFVAIAHPVCFAPLSSSPISLDVLEVVFGASATAVLLLAWFGLRKGYDALPLVVYRVYGGRRCRLG